MRGKGFKLRTRRSWLALLCAALATLAVGPAAARGDANDPLPGFPFFAGFEGPCGLAVDGFGFYVSDYYHNGIRAFKPSLGLFADLPDEDPLSGPCGLAVGASGNPGVLYVNNFHRNVVRYTPTSLLFDKAPYYNPGTTIDSAESTGVAVDPVSGNVYVDDRTYVAVYQPSGAPVEVGGEPLRVGLGSLEDGYSVAVSGHAGTDQGNVYVPDAATGTVKVYDPATDPDTPIGEIDGHEVPGGGFVSLRDSAVAVDHSSGLVYVADNLQPAYFEHPEAAIYAFNPSGVYAGRLKYNIFDAQPPGLAIGGGRVYVTSGNSYEASVIAYTAGALVKAVNPPLGSSTSHASTASGEEPLAAVPAPALAASSQLAASSFSPRPQAKRRHVAQRRRTRHKHRRRHPRRERR